MKKYITLIALCLGQGLSGTVISLLTLTSALVGKSLAPTEILITLPMTMTVLGSFCMIYYASLLMKKYGRRRSFVISGFIGISGAILAIFALYYQHFMLFLFSTFILGNAAIFNQFYRFAAAEIFDNEIWKKRSTSLVIGSGIIGGILGPFLAGKGGNFISNYELMGNFIFIIIIFSLLIFSQLFIFIEKEVPLSNSTSLLNTTHIYRSNFIIGTLSCTIGFSLMTLIMNSAPLSMYNNHYPISQNVFALQLHFIGMYAPALFIPFLIEKIKTATLILFGSLCFIVGSISIFLLSPQHGYVISLFFAGIGWAFMFSGGTFYLNEIHHSIKHKLQSVSSIFTYSGNLTFSFLAGFTLAFPNGWQWVNIIVISISSLFFIYSLIKGHHHLKSYS
ncbi:MULTISPECIES: MFS transporter [unclassified Pasteurella]|uniref:MFS transporter n=1 Tax=unclassified Pasteurella TaxID=2621516 RepID=UPI001073311A|nr:MFS transporter [Pasteurella sp. 19428wF3_WM03]TFU53054.1 MFS transporter [Pasteurella sp. WM03]